MEQQKQKSQKNLLGEKNILWGEKKNENHLVLLYLFEWMALSTGHPTERHHFTA